MSSTACWTEPGGFPFPRNPDKSTASRRNRPEPSAPSFSFAARPAKVTESHDVKYFAGENRQNPTPGIRFHKSFTSFCSRLTKLPGETFHPLQRPPPCGLWGDCFLSPCCRRAVVQRQIPRYSGIFCQVGAGEKFLSEQAVRVAVFGKSVYNKINTAIRRGEAWACSNSSVVQAGSPLP